MGNVSCASDVFIAEQKGRASPVAPSFRASLTAAATFIAADGPTKTPAK